MEKIEYKLERANVAFFGDDTAFEKCCQRLKALKCFVYKDMTETGKDSCSMVHDFSEFKRRKSWPLAAALIAEEDAEVGQYLCACAATFRIPLVQSTVPSIYSTARFIDMEEERAEREDATLRVGVISRSFYGDNIKKELSQKFPDFKIDVFELEAPDFDKLNKRVGTPEIFSKQGMEEGNVRDLLENPDAVAYHAIHSGKADIVLLEGGFDYHPLPIAGLSSDFAFVEAKDNRIVLVSGKDGFGEIPEGATVMAVGCELAGQVSFLSGKYAPPIYDEKRHNLKELLNRNPDSAFVLPYFLLEENGINEDWLEENGFSLSETDYAPEVLDGVYLAMSETSLLPQKKRAALEPYLGKYESDEETYRILRWTLLESAKELLEKSYIGVCAGLFEKDGKYRFVGMCFKTGKIAKVDTGFELESLNDVKACINDFTSEVLNKFQN